MLRVIPISIILSLLFYLHNILWFKHHILVHWLFFDCHYNIGTYLRSFYTEYYYIQFFSCSLFVSRIVPTQQFTAQCAHYSNCLHTSENEFCTGLGIFQRTISEYFTI